MFFYWFAKNKQFKKGSRASGQIAPFLLVVLVIMLIAAIATINIGRVSLDKTCSANGADAGSLAAASAWASALNILTEINSDQIEAWFDMNYFTYGQIKSQADGYLNEAITDAGVASASALASLAVASSPPVCSDIWFYGLAAAVLDGIAATEAFEASVATSAFGVCAQFMQSLTVSFHEQQWKNYCDSRTFMHQSYMNAYQTGLTYAFSNSCIPAKLSDSQNDDFNSWMLPVEDSPLVFDPDPDAQGANFPASNGPYKLGKDGGLATYSWDDKIPQQHTVSATLDLPYIDTYNLQHTQAGYTEITDLLGDIISRAQLIAGALNSAAVIAGATATLFIGVFSLSVTAFTILQIARSTPCCCPPCPCCPWWVAYFIACKAVLGAYSAAYLAQSEVVVPALVAIVAVAGMVSLSLLKSKNNEAYDDWFPDGVQPSISCADAADLMIVKIDEVILTGGNQWFTTCTTTQIHPGSSSGIVATNYPPVGITSRSKAKFDGGDVGTFKDTYDPKIVDTS